MLTVSIAGFSGLSAFNDYQENVSALYNKKRNLLHTMLSASRERAISLTLMATLPDPFQRDQEFLRFNELGSQFASARLSLLKLPLSSDERAHLARQAGLATASQRYQEAIIEFSVSDRLAEANTVLATHGIPAQQRVYEEVQALLDTAQVLYTEAVNDARGKFRDAYVVATTLLVLLTLLIGLIVIRVVVRHIVGAENALKAANERFELATRGSNDGLWDWDIVKNVVYFSPRWKSMLGESDYEVSNNLVEWASRMHIEDIDSAETAIYAHLSGDTESYEHVHRMRHRDGHYRWHLERGMVIRDQQGRPVRFVGKSTDITDEKRAKDALFAEKERALVTLHSIGDAVITTDQSGLIDSMNPVAETLTGWFLSEAIGRHVAEVASLLNEKTKHALPDPVTACLADGYVRCFDEDIVALRRDGTRVAVAVSSAPIKDRNDVVIGSVMVLHDVSETRALSKHITWQATHDSLTGFINRAEFERRLEELIGLANREGRQHAFLYIDLDQFKVVNDTSGHVAGDELLRQLSVILHRHVRVQDDTIARLGGDEFGVLLTDCPIDRAIEVAERIRQSVKAFRFVWQTKTFEIGTSIGVVAIDEYSEGIIPVMAAADIACYAAKDNGRNRLHVYQPNDAELAQRHTEMQWVTRIKTALEEDRLVLYCQPIVNTMTPDETVEHLEILVRLKDNEGGLICPDAFIPAAERYGIMPKIDHWVVNHTLKHLDDLLRRFRTVSINLSGATLTDEEFHVHLRDRLSQPGVPTQRLCFEITETTAIANLAKATAFIREFKDLGCRFALDDFGSGLSSFAYLKNLPVDYLKIDGCFVRNMANDPIDRAMVRAIAEIGHVMGIETIAEFVENDTTLNFLQDMGVDYSQGYGLKEPYDLYQYTTQRTTAKLDNRYLSSV